MGCPFFQPTHIVENPAHPTARLPLIREYEGLCHATATAAATPAELRFPCCNKGYSRAECVHFPEAETLSCLRYTVRRETAEYVEVLCVQERDHTPVHWQSVRFEIASGLVRGDLSLCSRAQVEAFTRSYLQTPRRQCGSATEERGGDRPLAR